MKPEALNLWFWSFATLYVSFGCPDHTPDFRNYVSVDCPIIKAGSIPSPNEKRVVCGMCWLRTLDQYVEHLAGMGKKLETKILSNNKATKPLTRYLMHLI